MIGELLKEYPDISRSGWASAESLVVIATIVWAWGLGWLLLRDKKKGDE